MHTMIYFILHELKGKLILNINYINDSNNNKCQEFLKEMYYFL